MAPFGAVRGGMTLQFFMYFLKISLYLLYALCIYVDQIEQSSWVTFENVFQTKRCVYGTFQRCWRRMTLGRRMSTNALTVLTVRTARVRREAFLSSSNRMADVLNAVVLVRLVSYMCVHVYTYMNIYIYKYVYMYIHIYKYVYTHM